MKYNFRAFHTKAITNGYHYSKNFFFTFFYDLILKIEPKASLKQIQLELIK